jgi:lipase chaperone LimK
MPRHSLGGWGAGLVLAGAFAAAAAAAFVRAWPVAALSASGPAPAAAPAAASAPFAPSLAGTTTDGIDPRAAGPVLVLEPGLIRLFDHYLATLGERSIEAIRAQVAHELRQRFAPAAARQAEDVLDRYLAFREALRSAAPHASSGGRGVDLLRDRLRAMRAIRSQFFGDAEAQALFGPADREAAAALERMAVEQDPALDPDARRARLAALAAAEPDAVRAARDASMAVVRLDDAVRAARARGASDDDVWHLRATAASPDAADRLAELDRAEAAWQARIDDYLAQRRQVLGAGSPDASRQEALAALRSQLFTPAEQKRLAAYER